MFSYLIAFAVINKYGKGGVIQISTVFAPLPYCLLKSPLKREFLDIYFATYFGARIFRNISPIRRTYFLKMFKM